MADRLSTPQCQPEVPQIDVTIIAKSRSYNQLCILGFDGTRILRLLGIGLAEQQEIQLLQRYSFSLNYDYPGAIYPHKSEDVAVLEGPCDIMPQSGTRENLQIIIDYQNKQVDTRLQEISDFLEHQIPNMVVQAPTQISMSTLEVKTNNQQRAKYLEKIMCENSDNFPTGDDSVRKMRYSLFEIAYCGSLDSINNTFKGLLDCKYVEAGTKCPSATMYVCNGKDISKYTNDYDNKRCVMRTGPFTRYDLPYTGIFDDYNSLPTLGSTPPESLDYLVVLSLGRPWDGKEKNYNPQRCYVLVVGVYKIPICK